MRHGAAHHPLKQPGKQVLKEREHVLLIHEAALHVDLGELRLAVGAQVLVAKAAGHLIVLVDARHHQKLLVDLRALGQGVERAGMHAAWHQIVPRALRRGFAQDGRLHLQKALIVEKPLDLAKQRMAKEQVSVHLRAAQVQITVFEPELLAHGLLVGKGKGQRVRRREQFHMAGGQLHLARGQGGVIGALVAQAHLAGDLDHALVFEPLGQREAGGVRHGLVKHRLHHALAVAHVHEDDAAHVAAGQHPAAHRGLPANVHAAQGSAVMRSFHEAATSLIAGYEKSPPPRHLRGERPKPSAVPPALDKPVPLSAGNAIDPPALYRARPSAPTEALRPFGADARGCSSLSRPCRLSSPGGSLRRPCGQATLPVIAMCGIITGFDCGVKGEDKKNAGGRTFPVAH